MTKTGSGSLILSGDFNDFDGVIVNAGTLTVAGDGTSLAGASLVVGTGSR